MKKIVAFLLLLVFFVCVGAGNSSKTSDSVPKWEDGVDVGEEIPNADLSKVKWDNPSSQKQKEVTNPKKEIQPLDIRSEDVLWEGKNLCPFGIELGSGMPFDLPRTIDRNEGAHVYSFNPDNKFRCFSRYVAFATPITHIFYCVKSLAVLDSAKDASLEFSLTLHCLENIYGNHYETKENDKKILVHWELKHNSDIFFIYLVCCKSPVDFEGKKVYLLQLEYLSGKKGVLQKKENEVLMNYLQNLITSEDNKSGL